ncbi:MAG: class I SAM-dependent methyltransferase [Legionellales bacterium]|nr:class I SAM-dependent methyltransferase [Legionellales bacterium]
MTSLVFLDDILTLQSEGFSPLWVDFSHLIWQKRRDAGKKQGLVRACKPASGLRIVDATAGWGRDAAILASFGAQVLMLERHPVVSALLQDGLRRLSKDSPLDLSLLPVEAKSYLQPLLPEDYPDVIYLDPMHPVRQKSALVKKEMQVLQNMIGKDTDVLELLHLALTRVRQRVVVKWPQRAAPLLKPTRSISGKTIRFDVYERS